MSKTSFMSKTSWISLLFYKQAMAFVSITRLRIRSFRFMPLFIPYTLRSLRQVKRAPGFRGGSLLPDRNLVFWTMTTWDSEQSMRAYMLNGAHRKAMPHLLEWCDEASVVHWDRAEDGLPQWTEADQRMRREGRASKVRHPSPNHAALTFREPRLTDGGPIHPVR